jgi:hypothetical protein
LESHFLWWKIIGHFVGALVNRSTSKDHNLLNFYEMKAIQVSCFKMSSPTFILWEMSNSTCKGVWQEETL